MAESILLRGGVPGPPGPAGSPNQTVVTATAGGPYTLNLALGSVFKLTLTAVNVALSVSNAPVPGRLGILSLFLVQDGSGHRTVTWPAPTKWESGTPPVLSTSPNATDLVTFMTLDGGGSWYGVLTGRALG